MIRSNAFRSIPFALTMLLTLSWPASSPAQIPDKFSNLKVLPKDITKDQLVSIMREIASGLGMRCHHCHVGEEGASLKDFDFASDDKKEKRIARAMMKMVRKINDGLIPAAKIDAPVKVGCVTCHHGVRRPETLARIMKAEVEKDGVEAAKAKYRELRDEYYGSAAYDFRPGSLNAVAEWVAEERNDVDGAIALMEFNIELDPNVAYSYNLLGRLQATKGEKAAAIASLKKSLELDPDDSFTKRILEKMEAEK